MQTTELGIGHNSGDLTLTIHVRLFNRILRDFGQGRGVTTELAVEPGTAVADILQRFGIPVSEVFIAFINGQDIATEPGVLDLSRQLEEGDTLALSGPVPYSWGYGAPVV